MMVSYKASGNISPCRFVVLSDQWTVAQADATPSTAPFVSLYWSQYAPGTPFDDGYIATDGDPVGVMQVEGETNIDTGLPVTAGNYLKPDANGRAIPATSGAYYGAQALESASASGVRIRCRVVGGTMN